MSTIVERVVERYLAGTRPSLSSRIARGYEQIEHIGMEHPTEEAKKKYLGEHPGADTKKHKVVERDPNKVSKPDKAKAKEGKEAFEFSKKAPGVADRLYKRFETTESYKGHDPAKNREAVDELRSLTRNLFLYGGKMSKLVDDAVADLEEGGRTSKFLGALKGERAILEDKGREIYSAMEELGKAQDRAEDGKTTVNGMFVRRAHEAIKTMSKALEDVSARVAEIF
jgi:hypothetical protein